MNIAREGWIFILPPLLLGGFLTLIGRGWIYPGCVLLVFGFFCMFFFRDPQRVISTDEKLVLSPADGTIMEVTTENGKKVIRIFLSVFNVHIQRSPIEGEVTSVVYKPGKCLPAMNVRAHIENDQNIITINTKYSEFVVKQISGILARRVVSWVKPNDKVEKGGKIGIIKFGSQVDLYVPDCVEISVKVGDKVVGGETVMGRIK